MANQTTVRIKRTSTSGNVPATGSVITPGELAINYTDQILYSTDGFTSFEIGANTTNSVVQNTLSINVLNANGTIGDSDQVLRSDGTKAYWGYLEGGHGFYRGNNGAIGRVVNKDNLFRVNANTLNQNTTFLTGENASATGPIEIAAGITLTVNSGARVVII